MEEVANALTDIQAAPSGAARSSTPIIAPVVRGGVIGVVKDEVPRYKPPPTPQAAWSTALDGAARAEGPHKAHTSHRADKVADNAVIDAASSTPIEDSITDTAATAKVSSLIEAQLPDTSPVDATKHASPLAPAEASPALASHTPQKVFIDTYAHQA